MYHVADIRVYAGTQHDTLMEAGVTQRSPALAWIGIMAWALNGILAGLRGAYVEAILGVLMALGFVVLVTSRLPTSFTAPRSRREHLLRYAFVVVALGSVLFNLVPLLN